MAKKTAKAKHGGDIQLKDLPRYDLDLTVTDDTGKSVAKGGVACPFPWRLHECLEKCEEEGLQHIISWQSHGRSFTIYNPKKFAELIMPRFFGQTRYASFQRQLNIYGFKRFSQGRDKGAYHHLSFVRGHRSLVRDLKRIKIKGTGNVKRSKQQLVGMMMEEHDFYHPAWKNHHKGSIPPALLLPQPKRVSGVSVDSSVSQVIAVPVIAALDLERVVSPVNSSTAAVSPTTSSALPDCQNAEEPASLLAPTPIPSKSMETTLPHPKHPSNLNSVSEHSGTNVSTVSIDNNINGQGDLALSMMMVGSSSEDDALAFLAEFPPLLDVSEDELDLIQQLEPTPILEGEPNKITMKLIDAARNIYAC